MMGNNSTCGNTRGNGIQVIAVNNIEWTFRKVSFYYKLGNI